MVKNRLESNQDDTIQHLYRNKKSHNHFGDNKLTVKSFFNINNLSVMSVLTIDNILARITDTKVKKIISIKTNNILFKK